MSNVDSELERMESWISGITSSLSPSARTRVSRNIAQTLKTGQAKRIATQRNPDGSVFAPRKQQKTKKVSTKALKFLYPSQGGSRVVLLQSYIKSGVLLIGFDQARGAERSFDKRKIIKFLPLAPADTGTASRPLRQRSTIKSRLMFHKLRTSRFLRSGSTANEAWVGFTGRGAQVARVHQEGGFDQPSPKSPRIRYAQRQLLGLTAGEEGQILDLLVGMVNAR